MSYDLALVADLCIDLLFTGKVKPVYGQVEQLVDNYHVELGGSAGIFASQFTKLGGRPALLGAYGKDAFGDLLVRRLRDLNIDDQFLIASENDPTAVGLGLGYFDDRAMLTFKGTLDYISPSHIESSGILNVASHIHINSFFLLESLKDYWVSTIPKLKKSGKTISLDTNWAPEEDWETTHALFPYIDIFLPNDQEAKRICNRDDVDEAGKMLSEICPLVVVKRGADGASVYQHGSISHFPVPEEIRHGLVIQDTTGAGDNFSAGFIFNWLKGESLERCMNLGLRCGTASLKEIGGINGQFVHDNNLWKTNLMLL